MILETVCVGPMQVNCYLLACGIGAEVIIIDPGEDKDKIGRVLNKHRLSPGLIINTHGHYDHIGCDDSFGAPVYIHGSDLKLLQDARLNLSGVFGVPYQVKSGIKTFKDKEIIGLDGIELEVLHIPGHTPGGAALLMKKPQDNILFSGDTLFCHGIGRSDLPGGDEGLLIRYIKEKLLSLPEETIVYPGHGSSTTIGEEKRNNPFL